MPKTFLKFHPEAAKNFNNKASLLCELLKDREVKQGSASFPSEQYIAASITSEDIIGDFCISRVDDSGNFIEQLFFHNKREYGLFDKDYMELSKLADKIQRNSKVSDKLSRYFIEELLFKWIKERFLNTNSYSLFLDYLNIQAELEVKASTVWIPIANLEIEEPFSFANASIKPLSKKVVNNWRKKNLEGFPENEEMILKQYDKIIKQNQGLAAVVIKVEAEPKHAFSYAIEEARRITSVLSLFSGETIIPNVKSGSQIQGSEYIAKGTAFFENQGCLKNQVNSFLDILPEVWKISLEELERYNETGFEKASLLLGTKTPSAFEKITLNAILLYSKSAFTSDPIEKVVYVLTSLESILLKDLNEPITQNLSERMAFLLGEDLKSRKEIKSNMVSIYNVRSKYLHHGQSLEELNLIQIFLRNAWVFFIRLLINYGEFTSKEDFIGYIDDKRLS